MSKGTERMVAIIIVLGALATIISLFVFWLYPTHIESAETSPIIIPFQFGVFDSGSSNLGITVKNTGRPHFNSCIQLSSTDKHVSFIRYVDCYEFFNKGETHKTQFIINASKLFQDNPKNFTLTYSSNTNWEYSCMFIRNADNYYEGQNCVKIEISN